MILRPTKGKRSCKASRAFTLVEIIIAMGIAGIVAVSLYAGLAQTFNSLQSARQRLRATQILVEKLEVIRLYNWDQINTPGYVPEKFTEHYEFGTKTNSSVIYNGKLAITTANVPSAYTNTMRRVVVQIEWTSSGKRQQERMETLVSQYGVQNYIY